jgi:hypothetical protein
VVFVAGADARFPYQTLADVRSGSSPASDGARSPRARLVAASPANGKLALWIEMSSELHLKIPTRAAWLFSPNHRKVASPISK